jgi:predicted RNase H-like nuclease (RuvC/YqgF family)
MAEERRLWDDVAANRTRTEALEVEVRRLRDAMHAVRAETAGLRYFGEKIGELSTELHELATKLDTLTRHALAKPTSRQLSTIASLISTVIAVLAFVYATTHGR